MGFSSLSCFCSLIWRLICFWLISFPVGISLCLSIFSFPWSSFLIHFLFLFLVWVEDNCDCFPLRLVGFLWLLSSFSFCQYRVNFSCAFFASLLLLNLGAKPLINQGSYSKNYPFLIFFEDNMRLSEWNFIPWHIIFNQSAEILLGSL